MEFARVLSGAGRLREATGVLRRLLVHRPSPPVHAFLGELLLASGILPPALPSSDGGTESRPLFRPPPILPAGTSFSSPRAMPECDPPSAIRPDAQGSRRGWRSCRRGGRAGALAGHRRRARRAGEPEGDLVLPIMSLPALFGLSAGDLPVSHRYMTVDPVAVTNAARAFAHLDGFRVGFALDGMSAADAAAFTAVSGAAFVALDAGAAAHFHGLAACRRSRRPRQDSRRVTEPRSRGGSGNRAHVAALAGAMGRPAFVIGPDRDDWLWLKGRAHTWFPAARSPLPPSCRRKGCPAFRAHRRARFLRRR